MENVRSSKGHHIITTAEISQPCRFIECSYAFIKMRYCIDDLGLTILKLDFTGENPQSRQPPSGVDET